MPAELGNAFEKIKGGESKLSAFRKVWTAYWSGAILQPLGFEGVPVDVGKVLSDRIVKFQNDEAVSTFIRLRNGGSVGDYDRSAVLVISSIFTGLALDRDTAKALPELLTPHGNSLPPVRGDMLLYKIALDAVEIVEPVGGFSDEEAARWMALAQCKNPVYRMIALTMFGRLCSEANRENEFLQSYLQETDPRIGTALLNEVMKLPIDLRRPILIKIESEQAVIGNKNIAELARHALDGN